MKERVAFGLELQRARERRGLSLDELAEHTKISGSLFAGLERGDLSRWPSGIFRRAFVRSYAQAVGLDAEETVRRFLRLYHDAEDAGVAPGAEAESLAAVGPASGGPRLLLADVQPAPPGRLSRLLRRTAAALVDIALAGLPAFWVAVLYGREWFWIAAVISGVVGHLLTYSVAGTTPGGWLLRLGKAPAPTPALPADITPARAEAEVEAPPVVASPRRRQPRHASGPRPVATARSRRVQY